MRAEALALAAAAALLSSCDALHQAAPNVDWDRAGQAARSVGEAFDSSPQKERELGRELAANLSARFGLLQDGDATRYVNLVGLTVARRSGRARGPWRFGILDTATVNAYSTPGGWVFVTRGLLKRLRTEAELAGVLAHEVAHVEHRHAMKALRTAKLLEAGGEAAQAAGASDPRLAAAASALIDLTDRGFSRADELDADKRGVGLTAAAGYDARGLPAALRRLYGGQSDKPLTSFKKRHPPLADREKALAAALEEAPAGGASLPKRYRKGLETL